MGGSFWILGGEPQPVSADGVCAGSIGFFAATSTSGAASKLGGSNWMVPVASKAFANVGQLVPLPVVPWSSLSLT